MKVLEAPGTPEAIEGEFLVQFKTDKSLKNIENGKNPAWLEKLGVGTKVDTQLSQFNIGRVRTSNPTATGQWENLANILSSDPDIDFVEPNYVVHSFENGTPNDPLIDNMWFLKNISAFQAWDNNRPKQDVIVAVIDSGTHVLHEDFKGQIWVNEGEKPNNGIDDDQNGFIDDIFGWDFHDYDNAPVPNLYPRGYRKKGRCITDESVKHYESHGTHVAGTIAAMSNNNRGIAGIAPNVKIMSIKALGGPCGGGGSYGILNGLLYAVDNGAKIVNMSLGGYFHSRIAASIYQQLSDKGILIIAAAGNHAHDNDSRYRSYPASYPFDGIISVAASDQNDHLADFSNYGAHNVDLAAPGVQILSTVPSGDGNIPEDAYVSKKGTSMAAPVVTGAAALLLANNPDLTNLQIKQMLMNSVNKVPALEGKVASGGRLNIDNALSQRVPRQHPPARRARERDKEASGSVGGIRIFDNRSNQPKW
ncbi:S8 family peptidase [Terasakiella sp. A23]|uniref:S8 family peptidase n=1 Tax=Terasakiella sp. FCG-A23 TaxID=3080561 RepID=UPI002953955D|nr:S8 family peptidase [Terasakiella sp. A23]MDV7340172.1 S8 family peptidase [Terasakiella sp. A23]